MRLLLPTIAAAGMAAATYPSGKPPFVVENVVAFGDSYTDAGRLSAYITNNGSTPPPATDTSTGNFTSTGGYVWGQFATQELGAKFYDYAGINSSTTFHLLSVLSESIAIFIFLSFDASLLAVCLFLFESLRMDPNAFISQ